MSVSQQGSGTGTVAEQNPQWHACQRQAVRQPVQRDSHASIGCDGVALGTSVLNCGTSLRSRPCERDDEKPEEEYAMTQDIWDGHGCWVR